MVVFLEVILLFSKIEMLFKRSQVLCTTAIEGMAQEHMSNWLNFTHFRAQRV